MTREEIIEAREANFKKRADENGISPWHAEYEYFFDAWNAALDSLEIELHKSVDAKPYACFESGWNDALSECREAIEAQGVKVKP